MIFLYIFLGCGISLVSRCATEEIPLRLSSLAAEGSFNVAANHVLLGMGVACGHGDFGMASHKLNGGDGYALRYAVGDEGVAEGVEGDAAVWADAELADDGLQRAVGGGVVADVGKLLDGLVASDEGDGLPPEEGVDGQADGDGRGVGCLAGREDEPCAATLGDDVARGDAVQVREAQAGVCGEEGHVADVGFTAREREAFEAGELVDGKEVASLLYAWYSEKAEGVVVGTDEVAGDGLADDGVYGLQACGDGGLRYAEGTLVVGEAVEEVDGDVLEARGGLEAVDGADEGVVGGTGGLPTGW